MADTRRDCCRQTENLVPYQERPDLLVNKCKVCGARHFELTIDPGKLGLVGAPLEGVQDGSYFILENGLLFQVTKSEFERRIDEAQKLGIPIKTEF